MRLGVQTVERLRGVPATDAYGNDILDFTTPDVVSVPGCSVQPVNGLQYSDAREAITTLWLVWAPLATDVTDVDRIRHAGVVYDIDGPVERWSVSSPLDHLIVNLKAVAG